MWEQMCPKFQLNSSNYVIFFLPFLAKFQSTIHTKSPPWPDGMNEGSTIIHVSGVQLLPDVDILQSLCPHGIPHIHCDTCNGTPGTESYGSTSSLFVHFPTEAIQVIFEQLLCGNRNHSCYHFFPFFLCYDHVGLGWVSYFLSCQLGQANQVRLVRLGYLGQVTQVRLVRLGKISQVSQVSLVRLGQLGQLRLVSKLRLVRLGKLGQVIQARFVMLDQLGQVSQIRLGQLGQVS